MGLLTSPEIVPGKFYADLIFVCGVVLKAETKKG